MHKTCRQHPRLTLDGDMNRYRENRVVRLLERVTSLYAILEPCGTPYRACMAYLISTAKGDDNSMASENEDESENTTVEDETNDADTTSDGNDSSAVDDAREIFNVISEKLDKIITKIDDAIGSMVENGATVREGDADDVDDDGDNEPDSLEDMDFKL